MILDDKKSATFRKTINGFMPKQLSTKMVFQCLPLPEHLSASVRRGNQIEKEVAEQMASIGTLKVTGREVQNSLTTRKRTKSNNTRNRIKTIKIVMDHPQKLVGSLVDHGDKLCQNRQETDMDRVHIKTPKQIITSINRTLADDDRSRTLSKYSSEIKGMENPENMEYYQKMILDNPVLFKKIMVAYNASKRQTEREQTKINIRKIVNNNKKDIEVKPSSRPNELKLCSLTETEIKKTLTMIQYRQFQLTVNLSNKLVVHPPQEIIYKAYICKGNNGSLLKNLLKSRPWWSIRNRGEIQSCNLIWTEWKRTKFTNNLPAFSPQFSSSELPSFDFGIKTKIRSLRTLAEKKQGQMKKLAKNEDSIWKYYEKVGSNEAYLTWGKKIGEGKWDDISSQICSGKMYKSKKVQKDQKILNHVPGCLSLHSKKLLFHNLKHFYNSINKDIFSVLPLTFHITKGAQDPQFIKFSQYFEQIAKKPKVKGRCHNIWICKPGENSNRGNGITVLNNINEIRALANQKCSLHRSLIIQKYFQTPFLYNKRKFDIRCFILITSVNGIVKGYWYEEGYLRTASKQFSLKHLENKYIHLTNDAIQKKSEEYGKFQNCNKISYHQFQKYIDSNVGDQKMRFSDVVEKMKGIATDLIHSVATQLNPARKEYCFELFGLDFMMDEKLNPFLIEANSNPSVTIDGNVLAKIIPAMLDNVMKVAIDPIFPPPLSQSLRIKNNFSNSFQTNKMVLVYDSYYDEGKLESTPSIEKMEAEDEFPEGEDQPQDP